MVNIAGRSKGCSTCRKRRIKCDETRPICQKCQRLGLECDGPKGTTFVSASIVKSRRKIEISTSTAPPDQDVTPAPSSVLIRSNSPKNDVKMANPTTLLPGVPQEYYIMFARQHLDPSGPIDTALQELLHSTHFLTPTATAPTNATDMTQAHLPTVLSFATLVFGTYHNNAAITHHGLLAHGATLRRINAALSHPDCWRYDSVLVAVTTLAVQEAMAPSSPGGYLEHMLGIDRLLALRDPAVGLSPRTVGLYKCLRHLILFAALRRGRESVLARPGWKEVLRDAVAGEEERLQNEVYEVLADCSVLKARRDRLRRRGEQASEMEGSEGGEGVRMEAEAIRREAVALQSQLLIWRALWDADPRHIPIARPPCTASPPDPFSEFTNEPSPEPPLDTTDLTFLNPVSALMLLLYDVTMLYTLDILISLPGDDSREELVSAQNKTLIEMCRCVPEYQPPSARDVHASPVVHWAVQTAKEMRIEERRVAEVVEEILARKGGGVIAKGLR